MVPIFWRYRFNTKSEMLSTISYSYQLLNALVNQNTLSDIIITGITRTLETLACKIMSVTFMSVNIPVRGNYRRFQFGCFSPELEVWLMATGLLTPRLKSIDKIWNIESLTVFRDV